MKMVNSLLVFFLAYGLCFSAVINSFSDLDFEYKVESAPTFSYDRIDEVKRQCKSVLSSASELKIEDFVRARGIRKELRFQYGDWGQEPGSSPILPFDGTGAQRNSLAKPLNLASFWVTNLDLAHRSKKYVGVNGVLMLGVTADLGLPTELRYDRSRQFEIWPGHTQLKISLQGVYVETKENGGERVLCMLGETMLPSRESDPGTLDPWKWVRDHSPGTPPLLQDDQILVLIRYPKSFTLTKRVIQGEVTSLNQKSSLKYFDKVHVLSQLGKSRYVFSSEDLVSKACDPYPYKDDRFLSSGIDVYKGTGFCSLLERVSYDSALTIVPNWRCNGTDEYCSKLGPFLSDKEIRLTNGSFRDVKLYMQDIHCQETAARSQADSLTRVSAVFRAVHPTENPYIAARRSALNNMTVSVEGIWKPSSGQLCMVGCTGQVDAEGSSCSTRVCLYIPITFSIRQRSILVGTFSSINVKSSFFPLSFEKLVEPMEISNYFQTSYPRYSYSKIEAAGAILEKHEAFSFGTIIKKSFLQFPKLEEAENFLSSLARLAEDLTIHTSAFPNPVPKFPASGPNLAMDILSLGPLFLRSLNFTNFSTVEQETPYQTKAEYTEQQLLLNVSGQISLTGENYSNFSALSLEGLYDEHSGKMYLVGCRDVRASWKILFDSNDLEAGLDCLIEVVVSYPPTKSRWLADPTAHVSISSQRPEDDPLYFKPLKLRTFPIFYQKQREDILSRAGVEGILRILTLSIAVACITSQLFYARHSTSSLPFVSLVMLGVQALGYSLPLITGAEALFKRKASGSYETPSYDLQRSQWLNVVDYTVKLLVLVCFLLTFRLCQKVWKSRVRLLTQRPHEPQRVPSDRRVLFITMVLHIVGYITVLMIHSSRTAPTAPAAPAAATAVEPERFAEFTGNSPVPHGWQTELEEYIGLVQDFFLLPQVIANVIWQIDCRPLRKLYYIGVTAIRLFPHVYDYVSDPIPDPYIMGGEREFVNPNFDFFTKFGDIAIPVTAVLLAIIVFIQQRWDYDKLSQTLIFGRLRILPSRSVKYERLQSQPAEAELVSAVGVNGNRSPEKE